jgi:hypothetical protein
MGRRVWLTVALALGIVAIPGWGWWHAHSHAAVGVTVNDVALTTPQRSWGQVKSAELVLRDAAGRELAHARLTEPYGLVDFSGAAAGDCGRVEREAAFAAAARAAWQACFEGLSRWQATWVPKVASASVVTAGWRIATMPARARGSTATVCHGGRHGRMWVARRTTTTRSPYS